jgi:excisionase family DNA binding protein
MNPRARMTVEEIARRLDIGRLAVYTMLEQGIIPAIHLGRRWIVTRQAFENWEQTCGMPTGLQRKVEPNVT